MLPNWVIEHGTRLKHFLSPQGWTPFRPAAYSYQTKEDAAAWLAEAVKQTPAMFRDHKARVVEAKYEPKVATAGGTYEAEYDPFGRSAVG